MHLFPILMKKEKKRELVLLCLIIETKKLKLMEMLI